MKRTRIIVCLVALFLFGGVCGFALSVQWMGQRRAHWEDRWIAERMRDDAARLKLTPEQIAQARPLYDEMLADIRQVREDAGRSLVEAAVKQGRSLAPLLTPEQQQEFRKLADERRARLQPMNQP